MTALSLLCLTMLCAGCATVPETPRTAIVTPDIPFSLRSCKPAPQWVAQVNGKVQKMTQRDVARFVAVLQDAYTDCATKLKAINNILDQGQRSTTATR